MPESVKYAVKSSCLLGFLESVPDVANKLKAPITADRKFEDVVKSAQDAAVSGNMEFFVLAAHLGGVWLDVCISR